DGAAGRASIQRLASSDAPARIRATAGRDAAIDRIIELYREAIAEHAAAGPRDLEAEERAATAYLRMITPRVKEVYQPRQACERLKASNKFESLPLSLDRKSVV